MHVTGGTLQLEQTELTATQLETNVAEGGAGDAGWGGVGGNSREFLQQWPYCLQPSQVTKLKGQICRMVGTVLLPQSLIAILSF